MEQYEKHFKKDSVINNIYFTRKKKDLKNNISSWINNTY